MDLSSSSSSSRHATTAVSLRASTSSSSAQTLYYYNVDAILSELIRPATPKHGNLARPRLVKPEPIRPQQLVGVTGMNHHHHHGSGSGHSRNGSDKTISPVLNDRTEGARNPDPTQQQQTSPFYMDDNEEGYDHVGMAYGSDIPMTTLDYYYGHNSNIENGSKTNGSSKRSRDDEDILYYKKTTKSTTSEEIDAANAAALITPNPIQYYTTTTTTTETSTSPVMSTSYDQPQYIVYKNYIDPNVNQDVNEDLLWTTTPSATISYTIVKPIAMRPMDVIQHLQDHCHRMDDSVVTVDLPSTTDSTMSSCPPPSTKNLLHGVLDDGSMQVCG